MIMNEVQTYIQEMYIKFITGQANLDSDWDTYVNTIKGMGIENATQWVQDAYTAFMNR
jgi:putative aldouronate transport system substrate-binding protein